MTIHQPGDVFEQELVAILRYHWKLLFSMPVVTYILVYAITALIPVQYVSYAYMRTGPAQIRAYSALLNSPTIAALILERHLGPSATAEAKARYVNAHIFFKDQEPLSDRGAERLYRMEAFHRDPNTAAHILIRAIDALALGPSIQASPHRPEEPSWPNKHGVALLSGSASIPITFVFLILFRFYRTKAPC